MALLARSDLQYDHYSWTAIPGDDPRVTGVPDSTMFNRKEGYEVLSLINRFAEKHGLKQKDSGYKLEDMIRDHLPSNIRSRKNVAQWLFDHWENY